MEDPSTDIVIIDSLNEEALNVLVEISEDWWKNPCTEDLIGRVEIKVDDKVVVISVEVINKLIELINMEGLHIFFKGIRCEENKETMMEVVKCQKKG